MVVRVVWIVTMPSSIAQTLQAIPGMKKEMGNGIELVRSTGKSPKNGKIQHNNDDQNWNDD
jgi:hypothetical protein